MPLTDDEMREIGRRMVEEFGVAPATPDPELDAMIALDDIASFVTDVIQPFTDIPPGGRYGAGPDNSFNPGVRPGDIVGALTRALHEAGWKAPSVD